MGWRHCNFQIGRTKFVENRRKSVTAEIYSHGIQWKNITQVHLCGKDYLLRLMFVQAGLFILLLIYILLFQYSGWNVDNRDNYYPITEILDRNPRTDSKEICVALDLNDLIKVRDK